MPVLFLSLSTGSTSLVRELFRFLMVKYRPLSCGFVDNLLKQVDTQAPQQLSLEIFALFPAYGAFLGFLIENTIRGGGVDY